MTALGDLCPDDRPRERLLRHGAAALPDADLVAIVLGSGVRGVDALATADALVSRFGDLRRLASAGLAELCDVPGVGVAQACRLKAALALAGRLASRPLRRGERIAGPRDVFERVGRRLVSLEHEVLVALALDAKHRVLAEQRLADGGVCSIQVLPRDVFAGLVREAAVGTVFVHNHPSGDPTPSAADEDLTCRLRAAGALLGIQILDHVIVAGSRYYSFTEGRTVGALLES